MPGLIALVGGNEFRPECLAMDRALLSRLGKKPRVVVVPLAAARQNPALAAGNGVRHFRGLGAEAEAALIVDSATAREGKWLDLLAGADLLYFTGGDPVHLLETLRDSPAWEASLGVLRRGRTLAGSSAGAMVCGGRMWAPGEGWREGLGLLPELAVLPHHARLAGLWNARRMRASLPEETALVGIDEATCLAGPPWEVLGPGEVTVYAGGRALRYARGQEPNLPARPE